MHMMRIGTVAAMTITLWAACAAAEPPPVHPETWPAVTSPVGLDPDMEKAIGELMAKMTLEEKVGQVIQGEIRQLVPEDVKKYHLGSVLNGGGGFPHGEKYSKVSDWVALADALYEASVDTSDGGVAIPIIWGVDAVHGHNNVIGATLFPHNSGLGATHDPDLMKEIGRVTAQEVRATGLDWTFGPTVAVSRDLRWGRAYESYSENPELVAAYAAKIVEGLQAEAGSDAFLDGHHVIACTKHFLGDGGTDGGKDQGDNLASEADLARIHGAGYVAGLGAGVQTVMASFSSWHGLKMHANKDLLTDVLKGRMGFDGFVVGDWNAHGQVEGCTNKSCAKAINAGIDMIMVPEDWKAFYKNTLKQVKSGEIPMERLDDAVRRILRVKMRAGLFERGKPSSRPYANDTSVLGSPEHRAVARRAVRESLVLLKNDGGLLPLQRGQRVLVAGDGADDLGKQTGGWTITWQGTGNRASDFPGATSIWAGISAAVQGGGGEPILSADGSFRGAKPDVAIVVYGENPYAEFQGDLDSIDYQPGKDTDLKLLKKLRGAGIPVVSVFLTGRPLWTNPELNASDAFVVAWLPGTEGGGVADVLFRNADGSIDHDFQGKLSFSWPKTPDQAVLNVDDPGYDPLFPYGYGLTYAEPSQLGVLSEDAGGADAAPSRKVYFDGGPVPPWQLFVGDEADWAVPATGSRTTSQGSEHVVVASVDRRVQEDARQVRFAGGGLGQVYLQATEPIDISRESNGNLALAFDVQVDEAPTAAVKLRMDCVYPCRGELDLTERLSGMAGDGWGTVRIRLRCFETAGTDMTKVNTPFLLATDGKLALRFSDVRMVTEADGPAPCP